MAQQDPNNPEYQLYLEYHRKKRFWKIVIGAAVVAFFAIVAIQIIPNLLPEKLPEPKDNPGRSVPPPITSPIPGTPEPENGEGGSPAVAQVDPDAPVLKLDPEIQEQLEETSTAPVEEPVPEPRLGLGADVPVGAHSSFREQRIVPASVEEERHAASSIDQLIERYNAATTPDELADLILYPKRVLPLIREYYARPDYVPVTFGALVERSFFRIKGYPFAIQTHQPGDGSSGLIFAGFRLVDGYYYLDWESFVGYGEKSWEACNAEQPTEPVLLRCYNRKSDYYNYEFSDATVYASFLLHDKRAVVSIQGFVERGSDEETKLLAALELKNPSPLIVRIAYNPDTKSRRCARIVEVIQETWITVEDDAGVSPPAEEQQR